MYSQKEESNDLKLPPFHMLPKDSGEVKEIYTLPYEGIYQVINGEGKIVLDSIGEFIDLTQLNKGIYYISFEGEEIEYNKHTGKPVAKPLPKPKAIIYDLDK